MLRSRNEQLREQLLRKTGFRTQLVEVGAGALAVKVEAGALATYQVQATFGAES